MDRYIPRLTRVLAQHSDPKNESAKNALSCGVRSTSAPNVAAGAVLLRRLVSFQWKNPDFLLKNLDFLLKDVDSITSWRTSLRCKHCGCHTMSSTDRSDKSFRSSMRSCLATRAAKFPTT